MRFSNIGNLSENEVIDKNRCLEKDGSLSDGGSVILQGDVSFVRVTFIVYAADALSKIRVWFEPVKV